MERLLISSSRRMASWIDDRELQTAAPVQFGVTDPGGSLELPGTVIHV